MIEPRKITKFSGPPGTGKSTTLLNVVESLLSSGVDPEHIVYSTFTRAGAYEARDRACSRFNLPPGRLPYFKTLHALCFGLMPKTDVMQLNDWRTLGRSIGVFLTVRVSNSEEFVHVPASKGDQMLHLWSLSRSRLEPLRQTYDRRDTFATNNHNPSWEELVHFVTSVTEYKRTYGKIDHTDMLERYLREGPPMGCKYIIIDEAQDLSALQWKVVEKLCQGAEKVWVAGDDDQCIYEWNGACPQHFIELQSRAYEVLPQSYRIPGGVHSLAQEVINRVGHRLPKEYRPRTEPGTVSRLADEEQLPLEKGEWLLLASSNFFLERYVRLCLQRCFAFRTHRTAPTSHDKMIAGITSWEAITKGGDIDHESAKNLYLLMSRRDRIKNGFKSQLISADRHRRFSYKTLVDEFGLVAAENLPWSLALDQIPASDLSYLKALEHRGELYNSHPRIRISTIHGAKGQEADNVAIITDLTPATREANLHNQDSLHRLFYVGVTRARQTLSLISPQGPDPYSL